MSEMESRPDVVNALVKREEERQLEIRKRKDDKSKFDAESEKLEYFQNVYQTEKQKIENSIETAECIQRESLPEHLDNIYKGIAKLQKYVAASNVFLRVYDIQKSNKELQELTNKTKELEERLLPKKKFGFKNKKLPKPKSAETNDGSYDQVDFSQKHVSFNFSADFCGFNNRSNETLVLKGGEILQKDVSVQKLTKCTVIFHGNPSTLHMSDLTDCTVLCGPVSTSVFAQNCQNCTIAVACQQLRLHNSKNLEIFLHVTSKGILEDCSQISVAPYMFRYQTIKEDYKSSGLDENVNNWDKLDDFNWLNLKIPSPNWKIIDEKDRILQYDIVIDEKDRILPYDIDNVAFLNSS